MENTRAGCIDLHTHTTASDGTCAPAELVALAKRAGLSAVAITDHDTIAGVPDALAAGRALDFEVVPGVELSADFRGRAIHMVGLFLECERAELRAKLDWAQAQRDARNAKMVARFNDLGIPLTLAEVEAEAGGTSLGRPHFAAAIIKKGAASSMEEAFKIYLSRNGKAYLPKIRFSAEQAIALVREAGGVPVLAHPMLIGWPPLTLDDAVGELRQAGLLGIEVLYSEHNPSQVQILFDIARRHDLAPSGGSDFHGTNKNGIELGCGRGDLAVPHQWLTALAARRA